MFLVLPYAGTCQAEGAVRCVVVSCTDWPTQLIQTPVNLKLFSHNKIQLIFHFLTLHPLLININHGIGDFSQKPEDTRRVLALLYYSALIIYN